MTVLSPASPEAAALAGDPFSPHKILAHFDRLRKLVEGGTVFPITVEIDPTNRCNHACQWCVSSEAHNADRIPLDEFRPLVADLKRLDVRSIVLKGGGEPTLHPDIGAMLRAAAGEGLSIGLISNGSMPHPGTLEAVLESADWVRVSLDAADGATHERIHASRDFDRIVENVAFLAAHATRTLVGLNFVAEPRNSGQILAFARLAKSLGVAYVCLRSVFDPERPLPSEVLCMMREGAAAAPSCMTCSSSTEGGCRGSNTLLRQT